MIYFKDLSNKVSKYLGKNLGTKKILVKLIAWNLKLLLSKQKFLWDKVETKKVNFFEKIGNKKQLTWDDYKVKDNENLFFDLNEIAKRGYKKIGVVFFCGLGDCVYASSFFESLSKSSQFIFKAYVGAKNDTYNSKFVADLLSINPIFQSVTKFTGSPNLENWKNYDYSECFELKDEDEFLIPLIYQYDTEIYSRSHGLCNTFNVPLPSINPLPILYDSEIRPHVQEMYESLKDKKVVFLQMKARSTDYEYPYSHELISLLTENGFVVICPDQIGFRGNNYIDLDTKVFNILDSINLVKLLSKSTNGKFYFCGVISCFASISSALQVPNLILQHFIDPGIGTVYFSNLYICTSKIYNCIPTDRQFLFKADQYVAKKIHGWHFFDYKPKDVYESFAEMVQLNNS